MLGKTTEAQGRVSHVSLSTIDKSHRQIATPRRTIVKDEMFLKSEWSHLPMADSLLYFERIPK